MKKTKFMIGALVLSMGLAGTGYALWSESITVSSTVKTGNFDIAIAESPAPASQYFYLDDNGNWIAQEKLAGKYTDMQISNVKVADDKNSVSFDLDNLVPASYARFIIRTENKGTVAAMLEDIRAQVTAIDEGLANYLTVKVSVIQQPGHEYLPDGGIIATETFSNLAADSSIMDEENVGLLSINQEDFLDLFISFELDKEAPNTTQSKQANITLNFDYLQKLASVTATPETPAAE